MAMSEDEMKIVIERLRTMPRTVKLNIGNYGSFTPAQLIEEISTESDIGKMIVEMQMSYIRSFKERVKE